MCVCECVVVHAKLAMQPLKLVSLMTFYVNSLVIAHEKFENCIKLALKV